MLVPAVIRRPTLTSSFTPLLSSTPLFRSASVSARVVSWNEAAEMNDSVDSDALVMPSKLSLLRVQRRVSGGTAKQVKLSSRFSGAVCRSRGASRAHLRTAGCSGNSAKGHIDGVIVRKEVDKSLMRGANALAI